MANKPKIKECVLKKGEKAWKHLPGAEEVEEDLKASRKSEDTDDPVDVAIFEPIAIRAALLFIKAGWPANAVTLLSFAFGVGGSFFFLSANRWHILIGIAFEFISLLLDYADGMVARLTHTSSQLGRVLDGTVDITCFLTVYIALGIRLMREPIPFTKTPWSYFIWIVLIVTMLFHAAQARMADYYRGLHLFFLNGSNRSNLARTKNLKAELAALPKDSSLFERIYRILYLIYTGDQERQTPRMQRLLCALENDESLLTKELSDSYISQSRKYIQLTNVLTYHVRTLSLYLSLLLGLPVLYFPIVLVVLEAVKIFMVAKYEGIAKRLYGKFC